MIITNIKTTEEYLQKYALCFYKNRDAITWSDCKQHNTVKVLVGIPPNGAISFFNKCYGGRMSDRQIVRESSFLDLRSWQCHFSRQG